MPKGQEVPCSQRHLHAEEIRIRENSSGRAQGRDWFDKEPA